jgi:hypothetical protein
MLYGVFNLNFFVQNNFTGPFLKEDETPASLFQNEIGNKKEGKELLSLEGENVVELLNYPHYLLVARKFLLRDDIKLPKVIFFSFECKDICMVEGKMCFCPQQNFDS